MTDLDAIKGRVRNAYLLDRDDGDALESAMGDVKTLVAEVERLRGERAAVVAWLREWSQPPSGLYDLSVRTSVLLEASDIIERGEHRREEEP